jgi:hypothetical protein
MAPSEMIGLLMTAVQAVIFYAIMAIVIWKVIRIENETRRIKNMLEQIRFLLERRTQ